MIYIFKIRSLINLACFLVLLHILTGTYDITKQNYNAIITKNGGTDAVDIQSHYLYSLSTLYVNEVHLM